MHEKYVVLFQAAILWGIPAFCWSIPKIDRNIPYIVVQIFASLALGKSVLGRWAPGVYHAVFPEWTFAVIEVIGYIALTSYMALLASHIDVRLIVSQGLKLVATSLSSVFVPLLLGFFSAGVFISMFPDLMGSNATPFGFQLGVGILVSVTALPVLSLILQSMEIISEPIGSKAIAVAVVSDVCLWILVTILKTALGAETASPLKAVRIFGFSALFCTVMLGLVRPWLMRLYQRGVLTEAVRTREIAYYAVGSALCGGITDWIGIHSVLGAFIFGLCIPRVAMKNFHEQADKGLLVYFLPFFFMSTGLQAEFDPMNHQVWVLTAVLLVISTVGKYIGTAVPAWLMGDSLREALKLGGLAQCKGLMDVAVAMILLEAGIISSEFFAAILIFAAVSTLLTKPLGLLVEQFCDRAGSVLDVDIKINKLLIIKYFIRSISTSEALPPTTISPAISRPIAPRITKS